MSNNTEHLNFDDVSFDPVEMDDMDVTHFTDDGDINLEMSELNDHNDIPLSVPISPKSQEQIADSIEEVILSLLESGEKSMLLLLTGERPDIREDVDSTLHANFASEYTQACLYNPALKWYAKLANILPNNQFGVKGGSLNISLPKSAFEKAILPFLGDFDRKFYEKSPLVHLVLDCVDNHFKNKMQNTMDMNKQEKDRSFEEGNGDLDIGNSEVEDFFDTDEVEYAGSNTRMEDNNSLNQSEIREVTASSLKLADLSNKAIAEYLISKNLVTDKAASAKLDESINEKARKNEILSIMRYMQNSNNGPLQHLRPMAMRTNPNKDDFTWD